jgi:glycosyltransferase involved in cell wall biosynthesis
MIFINGRFLTMTITGVQRYAQELFRALDEVLLDIFPGEAAPIVCFVPPGCSENPRWKKIDLRVVGKNTGNLWEQIDLPWNAQAGLLFSPANIGPYLHPNQVVTIHDASVFAFPRAYSLAFRMKYRLIYPRMAKVARKIITVSQFSRKELVRYCRFPEERIEVIAHGCEHLSRLVADESILDRCGIRKRSYLLGVGSWSLHKNFDALIKAFQLLGRDDLSLVLVGGEFKHIFRSSEKEIPANTIYLRNVRDNELQALYQNAVSLVFPSIYEGFGLPVLEAMSAGCPVICSHASSLPEVGGEAALYFDPHNVQELSDRMRSLLDSDELRESMQLKGKIQSQKFSWKEAARKTWEILVSVAR